MKPSNVLLPLMFIAAAGVVQAGNVSGKTYSADVIGARSGIIPPTDSVEAFEARLKDSYTGTYMIYGTLPEQHKMALYASIKEGGDIKDFRNRVINIRLQRH